jgi:hypothetical protein
VHKCWAGQYETAEEIKCDLKKIKLAWKNTFLRFWFWWDLELKCANKNSKIHLSIM